MPAYFEHNGSLKALSIYNASIMRSDIDIHAFMESETYRNGSFIHGTIFSQISQKSSTSIIRENIIVNSYANVALLQCYILAS